MSADVRTKTARKPFTLVEDARLRELAPLHKEQWDLIAPKMAGRNARQCRERWLHYLSPSVSMLPWMADEDKMIEEKVERYGKRWKGMETYFPGRTDTQIKNRYKVLCRRRQKERKKFLEVQMDYLRGPFDFPDQELDWELDPIGDQL
jgi:hypothetical protein